MLDSKYCALCADGGTGLVAVWCPVFVTFNHAELVNWQTHSERGAALFCVLFHSCRIPGQIMEETRNTSQTFETLFVFVWNTKIDSFLVNFRSISALVSTNENWNQGLRRSQPPNGSNIQLVYRAVLTHPMSSSCILTAGACIYASRFVLLHYRENENEPLNMLPMIVQSL